MLSKRRKGQSMITGILRVMLSLFVFAIMLPVLNAFINIAIPSADGPTTLILQGLAFFILLGIIIEYFNNPTQEPRRQQYGGY